MKMQRAQEIAASPVMAAVTYNEAPVYIQHVDEKTEKVRIYPLDQPENELEVSLHELIEQKLH
ncbi:H-type small acid-soluble spore protein [Halobacillus salinarum]|uniref:Small, acid-soluble spore protein H n=1 Tax=Halobacillus salinarum TaxID=2932257 RepID=A0ABY4EJA2_9BACI|nr:H-type small acid-soluble spore protein [Halobacillus salinarum]UOQ44558.1 H-type small acid-soluble spore protein [Halobacillus salinarum]